ncbi:MAG: hypothetical protein EXS15_02530 [Phycisphaerales bacterium]|nr:hypothetical protein [Phycisphaerales bacterium]
MKGITRMNTLFILLLLGCQTVPLPEPPMDPASRPVPMPDPLPQNPTMVPLPDPSRTRAPVDDVDEILDGMEAQGRTMRDFSASATMEKLEALTEEREIRKGRVVVVGPSGAGRTIAIVFDETIDSTGRGSTDSRRFIFSDGWLTEFDVVRKQAIRRQLAREGEAFDPLRVGDGPFPVPLGQPKKDVLREFAVTIGEIPSAPFFRSLAAAGADGTHTLSALRLVPRAGTAQARDTTAIVIVLDRATLAPRAVEVEAVNGDRTRVLLRNSKLNEGLNDAAQALLVPPSTEGWKVDTRPME